MRVIEDVVEEFIGELTLAMVGKKKQSFDTVWKSVDKNVFLDKLYAATLLTLRNSPDRLREAYRNTTVTIADDDDTLPAFPVTAPPPTSPPFVIEGNTLATPPPPSPPPPPPQATTSATTTRPNHHPAEIRKFVDEFMVHIDTIAQTECKTSCAGCDIDDPSQMHHACLMGPDWFFNADQFFERAWKELDVEKVLGNVQSLWKSLNGKGKKRKLVSFL